MADIRINSLPSTATSFNTDDYIAIDGASGGTRKMLAATLPLTDVTFGSSGPSAKSSIAARAARQGLVFDGTAGATVASVPAFGTGDFTVSAWVRPNSLSVGYETYIVGGATGCFALRMENTTGLLSFLKIGGGLLGTSSSGLTAGKWALVTLSRSSGSNQFYINGVAIGSAISNSADYTVATTQIGNTAAVYPWVGGLSPLIYNRALSAAEVVALYEAGVPAGADYNTASNTLLNTSTALNAYSTSFTTFTGASATGFTASDSTASKSPRVIFPLSGTLVAGRRYRAKFTATLTAMSSVNLWQSDSSYAGLGNLGAVSSGSNEFTFTATSSVNAIMLLCTTDGSVGTHSVVISGLSVDTPGLLLAPDAAQAGGGLTWYDTSGNAANITLPASGVSWNVPSSSYWGGNLNVSGTGTSDFSGNIRLANTKAIYGYTLAGATGALISSTSSNNLNVGQNNANWAALNLFGGTGNVDVYSGATGFVARFNTAGNFLVGTTVDSGAKLQVGTNTTTSAGGMIFGTDTSFYRAGNGFLHVDTSTGNNPAIKLSISGTAYGWLEYYAPDNGVYLTAGSGKSLILRTNGGATALTLDSSQNATFAGRITGTGIFGSALNANSTPVLYGSSGGTVMSYSGSGVGVIRPYANASGTGTSSLQISPGGTLAATFDSSANTTFVGSIAIGNTVQTAAAVASTHKVTISIGGSTYYLLATNV